MSAADPNVYMSDSEDDEDFVATAADLAAAAEAADMPEEENSDDESPASSSDGSHSDQEEVGLALARDMLPVDVAIECLNTKTQWGRDATTISSRKCKLSPAHCPADGKVAVLPIEDLLPTSGGIQLDLDNLWATATRGNAIERYLLVAMELNDGPENAQWRLWQLPMATDQRLVREIVATSGVEFTDDLKKKLVAASDPANRSLDELPAAVAAAFKTYGGLVYSSATYQKLKPRTAQATKATPAAKPQPKPDDMPPPQKVAAPSKGLKEPPKKRKPVEAVTTPKDPARPQKRPKPAPSVVAEPAGPATVAAAPVAAVCPAPAQSFTLTITTSDPATIARVLETAQKTA